MNDEQFKNMGILLQKNEQGNLNISKIGEITEKELEDCNIVVLSEEKYASLRNKDNTKILMDKIEDKQTVALILKDSLLEKLKQACIEKKPGVDSQKLIKEVLEYLVKDIENVQLEEYGGIKACSIKFKPKEKSVNESISSNHTGNISETIQEIDMSNINPEEVIQKIKKKVIAQDKAVETIVNNIYNNQIIFDTKQENLINSGKSSILMDGPTGTGKTLIIKQVAKELSLPLITRSATMYSAAGYKGSDLNELLVGLLEKTGGNLELAERGIVVLDEFDKLGGNSNNELEMKKAVQQELLTYMSGAKFPIEYNGKTVEFDTSRLTFICLGAFTDLRERKIKEELAEDGTYQMKPEDYIQEGLLREIVGRFSLITATKSLGKKDLIRILKESEISPLIQLQELGRIGYQKDIQYSDEIVEKIAELALEEDTGARALQTVVNQIRNEILPQLINSQETSIILGDDLLQKAQESTKREVAK